MVQYTSPEIQNSLISVMAGTVQELICSPVRKAGAYTILADETKDCSKKEQLAIVVRYVDVEAVKLFEHFLTYVEATALDANSLSGFILDALRKNQLNPECIVSQGYNGASVMSGHCAGVQQKICEVVPHAAYAHCYAHCLNLVLVDCTKSVSESSDFFSVMLFFSVHFFVPKCYPCCFFRSNLNYNQTNLNSIVDLLTKIFCTCVQFKLVPRGHPIFCNQAI